MYKKISHRAKKRHKFSNWGGGGDGRWNLSVSKKEKKIQSIPKYVIKKLQKNKGDRKFPEKKTPLKELRNRMETSVADQNTES